MDGGGWDYDQVLIRLEQHDLLKQWQWRGSDGWNYSPIFDSQEEGLEFVKHNPLRRLNQI